MSLIETGIQSLEGPFTHHLYIGFSPKDSKAVFELRAQLEKSGVICYLRSIKTEIQASIREGVRVSQKCLLFLSPAYLGDEWFKMETGAILEKADRFCRDVLILMKTKSLKEVPDSLKGFKEIPYLPDKIKDEKANAELVDKITAEPNVQLTVLPKQNIGYGSAFGYFYGFLRLTLPDFRRRLIEETLKNEKDLVKKTVKKMLIIMPESCFCAVEMESPDGIKFTGKYVVRVANRAGNNKRDYKSSLYKLIDQERNQEYYYVGEFATPLLTMFEMYDDGISGMTKDQLYAERDAFYFALKAVLSHPNNADCNDQFRLLYWSDPKTNESNRLSLYQFLLPVLREEIRLEKYNETNSSKKVPSRVLKPPIPGRQCSTFETVEVSGSNPSRIYENIEQYPMKRKPRGLCLIVNIVNFDKGHVHLTQRRGSERDTEILKKLFEDLHFNVSVHIDVSSATLESLFVTMHVTDHSQYDAFVCCILTHGKLGVIYTSDGKPVEILSLVEYFSDKQCPTLKGKPKMFFIQACQKGDEEPVNGVGRSPSRGFESDDVREQSKQLEEDARSAPNVAIIDDPMPANFKHKSVLVPASPDFLMSYSTLPGSISYRDTVAGSLYIQELDESLRKDDEMDRALKQVSREVKKKLAERGEQDGNSNRFQLPFHLTSGMDRLIFL